MVQMNDGLGTARPLRVDEYGRRIVRWIAGLFDWATGSHARACVFLIGLCAAALLPGFFSIPVVDRDEARFVQSSRQMVESGDYVDIRLGDVPRYKKPIGIYWMQSAVVGTAQALGVPDATRTVWLYRIPSLLGAVVAVLLTYWAGLAFMGRRGAVLAAILVASCAAVAVEARLGKTDAVLLATTVAVLGALARAYLPPPGRSGEAAPSAPDYRLATIFWVAIAVGILVKGPITPLIAVLTVATLAILDRSLRFMKVLAPLPGLVLCLLIVSPWFFLILGRAGDSFLAESVGRDMMAKVLGGQESHGAPPGAYLVTFWGSFWPAAPLALLAAPLVWRARRLRPVRFLLAWIVPFWILFEIIPTKLPHYVLPTFPAIAILIAMAAERRGMALGNTRLARVLWLWPVIGALIAVGALVGMAVFDGSTSILAWPLLVVGFFALVVAVVFVGEYGVEKSALLAVAGMLVSGFGVMQLIVPDMRSVWISPRLEELAAQERCVRAGAAPEVASAGFNEVSLMFVMPGTVSFTNAPGAAEFLAVRGCRIAFVERRIEGAFARRAAELGLRLERGEAVRGINFNNGRRLDISLYRAAP